MMKKRPESRNPVVRQMSVVPLMAVLIFALSNREVIYSDFSTSSGSANRLLYDMADQNGSVIKGKVTDDNGKAISGATVVIRGRQEGTITDGEGRYEIRVNRGDELVFSAPGKESATLAPGSNELLVQLKPAGKSDDSALKIAVRREKSDDQEEHKPGEAVREGIVIRSRTSTTGDSLQPLYVVDGKKVENLANIIPDDIESINVLKGNTAVGQYGEDGKNGVVIVQMKAGKTAAKKSIKGNPLVILDGKEYSGNMDNIPPGDISSVNVIKDSSLIKLYGAKARDGVILISTKTKYNSEISEKVAEGEVLPDKISTIDDFRRFIAGKIKYPALAQQNDIQGLAELWFVIEGDGRITYFYEKPPRGNVAGVDEIVVVGYGMKKNTHSGQEKSGDEVVVIGYASAGSGKVPYDPVSLLRDEVRRVVLSAGTLDIPELKGKTAAIKVRFVLQK